MSSRAIVPNREQFAALASAPDDGPVVMINLLKFKAQAADGSSTGAQSYGRYTDAVVSMVEAQGGRLVWIGKVDQVLIGDVDADGWDSAALVEYPSRKAFIDMVTSKDYNEAHAHREGGLERTVLLACTARELGR
jgi:uncharacterized protein (DUF1330 family)